MNTNHQEQTPLKLKAKQEQLNVLKFIWMIFKKLNFKNIIGKSYFKGKLKDIVNICMFITYFAT